MPSTAKQAVVAVLAAAATGAALSACGSADQPGYCDKRATLESDVQGLKDINLRDDGLAKVRAQLDKIRADARAVASAGKSDFPDETRAMQGAVDNLSTTVKSTSSSPSAQDVLFIGTGVAKVADSVGGFVDATAGSC